MRRSFYARSTIAALMGVRTYFTVSHLTGVTRRSEKEVNMFMAESHEGYKRCRPGRSRREHNVGMDGSNGRVSM